VPLWFKSGITKILDWLPLALLCALSLAAADTLTKRQLAGCSAAELVLVRFTLPGLLLLPFLLWQLPPWPALGLWPWLAVALPLEIVAMLLYVLAIRDSPLALTLPYLAFTPVFTSLVGYLLLGESLSGQGALGILLVALGAYGLNLDQASLARPRSWLAPLAAIARERGSRYMLGVAVIYGLTSVLGKGAMQYLPGLAFGPLYFVLLGGLTLIVFAAREPAALGILARPAWAPWLVAALMALMVISHFLALERVETAYMIAVKRTSILFGILLGALVFKEARLGRNLAAAGLMVAGVALIVL
jgi:drug/metabolite transporter (DMT)-like permease